MGCSPSHADIVHSFVKTSGTQLFKKPKAIWPRPCGDSERSSVPLLVSSAAPHDSGGDSSWRQTQMNEPLDSKRKQIMAQDLGWLSGDPNTLQEKDLGMLVPESRTSPSCLDKTQIAMDQGSTVKTQHSQNAAIPGEDRKETFTWKRKVQGSCTQKSHSCQGILPTPGSQGQVDFPEPLVKAHRHAYTFLHSSLSKYETILDLTHRASQTQELLQPMVDFLQQCFEETNRLLGEISRDGDVLLQEVEGVLAWPGKKGELGEQPDLLHQLLQHTVGKMQALQSAATTLTSSLLQATSSYLHTTAGNLGKKLSTKRNMDKHLLETLGHLEDLASGHRDPGAQGLPLCSEDSGIGTDTEPVQAGDKLGQPAGYNLLPEWIVRESLAAPSEGSGTSGPTQLPCPFQDCPFSRFGSTKVQPTSEQTTASPKGPSSIPETGPSRWLGQSTDTHWNGPGSITSAQAPLLKGSPHCRLMSCPREGADSSPEEEEGDDSDLCPGVQKDKVSRPRPKSSPASSGSTWQTQPGKLGGPQAQEMTLRMKQAISERIKFVPLPSGHPDWAEEVEEEEEMTAESPQVSTVKDGRGASVWNRPGPCLPETFLSGHTGGLMLQQPLKGQKDHSLKLAVFHALITGKQRPSLEQGPQLTGAGAQRPDSSMAGPGRPLDKLKASLTRTSSILPSQDQNIRLQCSLQPKGFPQDTSAPEKASQVKGARETAGSPPPRMSVKKLIETFSLPDSQKVLGDPKGSGPRPSLRKWGVPILPPRFPIYRGFAPLYPKPQISPASRELPNMGPVWESYMPVFPTLLTATNSTLSGNLDAMMGDNSDLPPPPLEILMDTSYNSLGSPKSRELVGHTPKGSPAAELGAASPGPGTWACPKLKAPLRPTRLLPTSSRGAASPSKSCCAGQGSRKSSYGPRKLPGDPHLPVAATKNRETDHSRAQRQDRGTRAAKPSKQSRKAAAWPCRHAGMSGSLALPAPGPHAPEAPMHNQDSRSLPGHRKASPRRTWSPPDVKRHPILALSPRVASSNPPLRPLANPGLLSTPREDKRASPNPQLGLPSPPPESPPAQHLISSPPSPSTKASPPSSSSLSPSPPVSPAQSHEELRSTEAKALGTTCSLFCLTNPSLLEAEPSFPTAPPPSLPSLPLGSPPGGGGSSPGAPLRGASQRGVSPSTLSPQPFSRKTVSAHRPGSRHLQPVSRAPSLSCEPQIGLSSSPEDGPGASELKGSHRAASAPELCVLGRGLHLEVSASQGQAQAEAPPWPKKGV